MIVLCTMYVASLLTCIWFTLAAFSCPVKGLVVNTTSGPLLGTVLSDGIRFLGIPYASPPLGSLRFRPPEPAKPWTVARNSTDFGYICMQSKPVRGLNMSEDCLTLSIFLPAIDLNVTQKRAVMVWFNSLEGGFKYDLGSMSLRGDIVVVTLNYRVGIFGFLTTGDEVIMGNAGLFDQLMALQWIKDNIEEFGGDKHRVTIFGTGAGGWSVNAHVLSPMSRGLFRRAISQDGMLDRWLLPHYTSKRENFRSFGLELGCEGNTTATVSCLEMLDARLLLAPDWSYYFQAFGAVEDGLFLPHSLHKLLMNWENPDQVDYLAGLNSESGDVYLDSSPEAKETALRDGLTEEGLDLIINSLMVSKSFNPAQRIILYDQYVGGELTNMTRLRYALDMLRDVLFLRPTVTVMDAVSSSGTGRAYMYYFQQKTPGAKMVALESYRAGHTSELPYLFDWVSDDERYDWKDAQISDAMLEAWTSFAKTGKPRVPLESGTNMSWPVYNKINRTYLSIQYPMTLASVRHRLLSRAINFWTVFVPALDRAQSFNQRVETTCTTDDSPSTIGRNEAEAALFILIAVVIVLLLTTAVLLANYCSLKKPTSEKEDITQKNNDIEETETDVEPFFY